MPQIGPPLGKRERRLAPRGGGGAQEDFEPRLVDDLSEFLRCGDSVHAGQPYDYASPPPEPYLRLGEWVLELR